VSVGNPFCNDNILVVEYCTFTEKSCMMPKIVSQIRVFISRPNDVVEEKQIVRDTCVCSGRNGAIFLTSSGGRINYPCLPEKQLGNPVQSMSTVIG